MPFLPRFGGFAGLTGIDSEKMRNSAHYLTSIFLNPMFKSRGYCRRASVRLVGEPPSVVLAGYKRPFRSGFAVKYSVKSCHATRNSFDALQNYQRFHQVGLGG